MFADLALGHVGEKTDKTVEAEPFLPDVGPEARNILTEQDGFVVYFSGDLLYIAQDLCEIYQDDGECDSNDHYDDGRHKKEDIGVH